MKFFIYFLIIAALGLLVFNITQINFDAPFEGESTVAAICVLAAACVVLLLTILLVSKKISEKQRR